MPNDLGQISAKSSEDQRSQSHTSQKDSLTSFMKTFMKDDQANSKRSKKKGKSKVTETEDPAPVLSTPPKKTKKAWRKKKKTSSPATTSPGMDEMTPT